VSQAAATTLAAATPASTELAVVEKDSILVDLKAKGAAALELARSLVVDTAEKKADGVELVARARRAVKISESRRTALVKPHNDYVSAINRLFKGATDPFRDVDKIATQKVIDFDAAERRRAAEAAAAAERERLASEALLQEAARAEAAGQTQVAEKLLEKAVESETGALDAQAQAVIPARVTATESGTVGVRNKPFTYRVLDEAQVPREYLCLDAAKIREAIRQGERTIPGLEIFQEEGLAVRA
jgi:hypothetical protein